MDKMTHDVLLHDAGRSCWLHFTKPRMIFTAHRVYEVMNTLQQVEEMVSKHGLHAAGFIAYEAAPAFDPALAVRADGAFPLVWFGIYDQPRQFDFPCGQTQPSMEADWTPTLTRTAYNASVTKIRSCIQAGDSYQTNFTFRLKSSFREHPWLLFVKLARAQRSLYGAYVDTGDWQICCASPELFFQLDDEEIISRPMKGTASRGLWHEQDVRQARWLYHSEKNRAENIMIVDMVRNDIGRIAEIQSVFATDLFALEKYPTLWQMTSTVRAKTKASLCAILSALFPAASITGAPKPRTMQIIAELETTPRRIYTGSIGFMAPGRRAQFNVAIRTVLVDARKQQAEYGVGGGIVWDSTPAGEFEECRTKAQILGKPDVAFSLLETILWTPQEAFFLLERHLNRLADSAEYFSFPMDIRAIRDHLTALARRFSQTSRKVRLLLCETGRIETQAEELNASKSISPRRVCLARAPVDSSNPFLYHKTTNRGVYDEARARCPGYDDVLLFNQNGELTESCLANIVVETQDGFYTPPVRCGLLAGTYRAWMLEQGTIGERVLTVEDLLRARSVFLVNSVRGRQKVMVDIPANRKRSVEQTGHESLF